MQMTARGILTAFVAACAITLAAGASFADHHDENEMTIVAAAEAAEADADLNEQDKWGNTPLHLAVRKGHAQIAMLLLQSQGADLDIANCVSRTI